MNKQTNAEANQQLAEKQGSSDSKERSDSATPLYVLPKPNSEEAGKDNHNIIHIILTMNLLNQGLVSKDTNVIVADDDGASNCANKITNTVEKTNKIAEIIERDEEEVEVGLKGRNTSPLSSSNSLNIESFIIATSTPSRNDSQQTSNNKIRSEMFKTTPTKRRSQEDNNDSSSTAARTYDYRSSPVRRRLLEAHASDKRRNTTPSPPLVFPKGRTKSEGTD